MMQSPNFLMERRKIWKSKKIIRTLYHKWYRMIKDHLNPGVTLEVGGGSGNLKTFFPDAISSDILFVPWLDAVLDAHDLPFQNESLDNIVLFDVLHHLKQPVVFFSEAQRTLKQNGRIILMEPYISWASYWIYKFLHPEGLNWNSDPFHTKDSNREKNHLSDNQAVPTLMFEKYLNRFVTIFPNFKIVKQDRTDFVTYPLSGGFHNPSLCPPILYPALAYLDKLLRPINRILAFRLFVVLKKHAVTPEVPLP